MKKAPATPSVAQNRGHEARQPPESTYLPPGWDRRIQWPSMIKSLGIPTGSDEAVADLWKTPRRSPAASQGAPAACQNRVRPHARNQSQRHEPRVVSGEQRHAANSKSLNAYMQIGASVEFLPRSTDAKARPDPRDKTANPRARPRRRRTRCLDIEFFVRAVYARWVRRLLRPTPMPWKTSPTSASTTNTATSAKKPAAAVKLRLPAPASRAPTFITDALVVYGAVSIVPAADQEDMDPLAAYFGAHDSATHVNANDVSSPPILQNHSRIQLQPRRLVGRHGERPPGFAARRTQPNRSSSACQSKGGRGRARNTASSQRSRTPASRTSSTGRRATRGASASG